MTRCSSATRTPSWFLARRVLDDELQRPALLVVDVGDLGLEGDPIAGADRRVILEGLRAVQDFADRHAHRRDVVPERVRLHLQAEGERRRRRQCLVAGGSCGRLVGIDRIRLADRLGEELQATFFDIDGLRRRRPPDMLLVDHVPPLDGVAVNCPSAPDGACASLDPWPNCGAASQLARRKSRKPHPSTQPHECRRQRVSSPNSAEYAPSQLVRRPNR